MSRRGELNQWNRSFRNVLPVAMFGTIFLLGATWFCLGWSRHAKESVLVEVEGKVSVSGVPAENVNVAFHPLNGSGNAFCPVGRTDSDGVPRMTRA